jgi:hypothetical protein
MELRRKFGLNNNNNDFCPAFHPGKLFVWKGIQTQQTQTLNIVEKAINFLKRKFDRFKLFGPEESILNVKEKLFIDKVDYGVQMKDNKFILWVHKRKRRWKILCQLTNEYIITKGNPVDINRMKLIASILNEL